MFYPLSLLLVTLVASVKAIDVQTEYGTLRGHTITVTLADGVSTKNINSFLGVPFATPPLGNLRFEPPQKAQPWTDVFVADTLSNLCMQNPLGVISLTHPTWTKYDEDCLNMNIYVPEDLTSGPFAVMVWFHGGAYTGGGNIQYPGHFLATKNVIVVIPNYRLGVFGFVNTPDGLLKGNMGLFDQKMVLEFVRDNIANFGGDPSRVTVFGQSAGASSTGLHLVSPLSRGLFYAGIEESGSDQNVWTLNYPEQNPENYVYQVAENANCTTDNTVDMVDCLRQLDQRDLRVADRIRCTPGYFCQGFAPIVDGPGGFVPDHPRTLRENLGADSVPLLSGICKDDGSLYTIFFVPETMNGGFNHSMFQYYLQERLLSIFAPRFDNETEEEVFEAMDFFYSNWPYIEDLEANRQAFNKILTDAAFGYAWDRQAKTNSEHAPTYTFVQAFRSLNASTLFPEWMGVPHQGELPYVWGYGYLLINPDVRNDTQIYYDAVGWTPEDIPYADYVMSLWANFATVRNPTPVPIQAPFNNTMTTWPQFRADDNFKVFYLDGEISVKEIYKQINYAFYTEYMDYITGVPIKKTSGEHMRRFSSKVLSDAMEKFAVETMTSLFPGKFEEHFEAMKNAYN